MFAARLYCILDLGYVNKADAEPVVAALLAGGADLLQLRAKNHDLTVIEGVARRVLPLCRAAGIPFILNDHPALAADLDADGVHLGQDDGSLAAARELTGKGMLIGRSTHSLEQARAALAEGFDYIGFGPLFPTPTKAGRPAIGLSDIAAMERDVGTHIPAFCIGGIHPGNLPQVQAAGARRIVMVSSLLQAADIQAATRNVADKLMESAAAAQDCGGSPPPS
ncbi:MAG: thiamine phosphate synthase [Verrucomicrobia bacterium]|nr:MAG: thiamine phosphate synthase [Verrucomicrobiota bacterium]